MWNKSIKEKENVENNLGCVYICIWASLNDSDKFLMVFFGWGDILEYIKTVCSCHDNVIRDNNL